jgi:hypothetical protein
VYRMRKRNLARREGSAVGAAFSALKKARKKVAAIAPMPSRMTTRRSLRSGSSA